MIDILLEASKDIWDEYNNHPFVKGIEDGSLDEEKFRYYIIQDYFYLIEYSKVFLLCATKSKDIQVMTRLTKYGYNILKEEMNIHKGYVAKFGITEDEIKNTKVSLDNLAYTSYMLKVAHQEGVAEILASTLACAYSYELIAHKIVENNKESINNELYGEWLKGYTSYEYREVNKELIEIFENLTKNYDEQQIENLKEIFITSSKYEMMFWDLSWEMIV